MERIRSPSGRGARWNYCGSCNIAGNSVRLEEQTFQVLSFGECRAYGVVRRLSEAPDDLGFAVGVQCGVRDDFLEQAHFHKSGTAEGREDSARSEELDREQVDVLVAARSFVEMILAFDEFRRVEDDEVECFCAVAAFAEVSENIRFRVRRLGGVESVQLY